MKYKPRRDIPIFAREYQTVSPSELAKIILTKRNKKVNPGSITVWFFRHKKIRDQLTKEIGEGTPEKERAWDSILPPNVLAELITSDYGNIKIRNLETLRIAKKLLRFVETKLKTREK